MNWYELYELVEQELQRQSMYRFELIAQEGTGFYISIDVFGEPTKSVVTKDYSTKELALEVAFDQVSGWPN